ncbi:ATP-dependent Clp protease proteolytic subunit [archaeon]|nr:ATP-dependent Clp protease proteolytic subunit [archaeon]
MNIFDALANNFWVIFLFFSLIYPRLQQGMLQNARENALKSLGRKRGTNVITLIHRQETLSLFGLPLARYIDIDDSEELLRIIRLTPDDQPIDLIVHTPGGIALAATQIAFALKAHKGKTTVLVPHYAMSGGTLIALAADEILMDPHAVLGPVDPQIGTQTMTYAATSIVRVVETKTRDEIDDQTLYLAEEARKAIDQMKDTVRQLLVGKFEEDQIDEVIENLVSGKYTHDFPITAEATCELLGRCALTELPREVYQLMDYYKMDKPQRKGIEYVPLPRPGRNAPKRG